MAKKQSGAVSLGRRLTPLSLYAFKDYLKQLVINRNFHDSLATAFAFISIGIAFPFYPLPIFIALLAAVFVFTLLLPLLGLMALLLLALPMFIYQAPLLAWIATLAISVSLILGYKNYRAIAYGVALAVLPLSYLGAYLELPALVFAVLVLGFKRSATIGAVAIAILVIVSNLANLPVSGPFVYASLQGHALISSQPYINDLASTSPAATLGNFASAWSAAFGKLVSSEVATNLFGAFYDAILALAFKVQYTVLQILVWLFVAFTMSSYAVRSRSAYKGTRASLFGAILVVSYLLVSILSKSSIDYVVVLSFAATPVFLFVLEASDVDVVQALDVMKQDILGKFGVAFEDLTKGTSETLDDVVNYEGTKRELKDAILAPIEHREIAGAYNVSPAKGLLLFGPPGTGKTLIMRALANDIRAAFYYVATSSLISPYPGESASALSKIFATARKHTPCVLFFDEIDSIAAKREMQGSQSGRELITTLLSEMDGFKTISDVVIVGATNTPQFLDPALMRPGRFDKVLYMQLPDQNARAKIFNYYLSKLPISTDMDYAKLASITSRFSPADIKNVCENVSREVGEKAIAKREVLAIKLVDVVRVIKGTKPSTSLAQLEDYNTFKIDYERRLHPETQVEEGKKVMLDDVIGLEEAKKALHEAVEVPILHPSLLKKYDIGNIKGILLFGPPGTGKTMLIQAVANELGGVKVFSISGYDIAKYGQDRASSTVKSIFDRAKESAPAMVFIDEIDALIPARDTASQYGLQLTGELLEEFDRLRDTADVVVVAATNRPDVLDPAMLRPGRFDRLVYAPPPDGASRKVLFQQYLEKAPLASDIDFGKLADATDGYTGADISNICRQVKLNALEASLEAGKEIEIKAGDIQALIQKARPSAPSAVLGRYLTFYSRYGKR